MPRHLYPDSFGQEPHNIVAVPKLSLSTQLLQCLIQLRGIPLRFRRKKAAGRSNGATPVGLLRVGQAVLDVLIRLPGGKSGTVCTVEVGCKSLASFQIDICHHPMQLEPAMFCVFDPEPAEPIFWDLWRNHLLKAIHQCRLQWPGQQRRLFLGEAQNAGCIPLCIRNPVDH